MKTISKETQHGFGVEQFLARHGGDVTGGISGFDRLRLARRWRRATSVSLGRTAKLPPRSRHWPLAHLGESPRTTPRRLPAQNTIRISGADLPSLLETGLFNRRPASRYGEAERSELGFWVSRYHRCAAIAASRASPLLRFFLTLLAERNLPRDHARDDSQANTGKISPAGATSDNNHRVFSREKYAEHPNTEEREQERNDRDDVFHGNSFCRTLRMRGHEVVGRCGARSALRSDRHDLIHHRYSQCSESKHGARHGGRRFERGSIPGDRHREDEICGVAIRPGGEARSRRRAWSRRPCWHAWRSGARRERLCFASTRPDRPVSRWRGNSSHSAAKVRLTVVGTLLAIVLIVHPKAATPPRSCHWPLAHLGESPRTTPRRLSARNTIRISGAHLPPSLVPGLFNRRPASRYSEAERSELGPFFCIGKG